MYHLLLDAQVPATKLYKSRKFGNGFRNRFKGCILKEEERQSSMGRDIEDKL
jgi:hypothetical protein